MIGPDSGATALSVSELNEYARKLLATDPLLRSVEVSGEISGSAITFASLEKASAPGQIALAEMKELLDKVHNGIIAEEE